MHTRLRNISERVFAIIICMSFVVMSSACSGKTTGTPFTPNEPQTIGSIQTGTISYVGQASIEKHPSRTAPIVGGVAGALIADGTQVMATFGSPGAMILGATAGAVMGNYYNGSPVRDNAAVHLTIDLDNGQVIQLVQAEDDIYMMGDRVRILYNNDGKAYAQH